jgi:hypothetical protein
MTEAQSFLTELEGKHHETIRRLAGEYMAMLAKESLQVIDAVKLEMRLVIEAIEVSALWLADSDNLQAKLALAAECGDNARKFEILSGRLTGLDVPLGTFDPRHAGYSKLFAFFRSLQSPEERASAGGVTMRSVNLARMDAVSTWCLERGDAETARVLREEVMPEEQRYLDAGRQGVVLAATNEECQARARRSSYRTLELVAEINEPMLVRKFLSRSRR